MINLKLFFSTECFNFILFCSQFEIQFVLTLSWSYVLNIYHVISIHWRYKFDFASQNFTYISYYLRLKRPLEIYILNFILSTRSQEGQIINGNFVELLGREIFHWNHAETPKVPTTGNEKIKKAYNSALHLTRTVFYLPFGHFRSVWFRFYCLDFSVSVVRSSRYR